MSPAIVKCPRGTGGDKINDYSLSLLKTLSSAGLTLQKIYSGVKIVLEILKVLISLMVFDKTKTLSP